MKNLDNLGSFRGAGRFARALQQAGIDVNIPIWSPFAAQTPKRTSRGVIVVFDVIPLKYPTHFPIGIKGKIKLFKNRRALQQFSTILTISQHAKNDLQKYLKIPEKRIKVVYPPLDTQFLGTKNTPPPVLPPGDTFKKGYILYVGDVNWNKNLPNLARAIKLTDVPCVFVGKAFQTTHAERTYMHPWMKSYREFRELADGDPRFFFPGYVSDEKLCSLYGHAITNILPSFDEGFGYSYIEAASQETPSIVANTPVFRETAGKTALFVDPEKPEEIAQTIESLATNKQKRDKLGKEARMRVLEMYAPERFKKLLHQVLFPV